MPRTRESAMMQELWRCLLFIAVGVVSSTAAYEANANELLVFISAFSAGDEGAIHAYQLQPDTGQLKLAHRTTDVAQPFFLALSRDRRFLYATHAPGKFGGKENEQVASYQLMGNTGQLRLLNRQSALG